MTRFSGTNDAVAVIREDEGTTLVLEKAAADDLGLNDDYVAT